MTLDLFAALVVYALVATVTPGPNNVMLLASGVNFGFRRTVPHMLGIALGYTLMVFVVGLGLVGVFVGYPPARAALQIVSVAYLLWLAWKIARAAPPDAATEAGSPLTFLQAAAFQWVNPKAWVTAIGAISLYAPGQEVLAILWVAAAFLLVSAPSVTVWAFAGTGLRRFLSRPLWLRRFNLAMAGLLIASLYPALRG